MPIPLRVLIVEDSPADADLMALRLSREGFQLDWQRVENENDYLNALAAPLDVVLSDWSLPSFSGMRAFQLMADRGLDLPFIIVSGSIGEESAVAIMRLGAFDYLLKDRLDRLGQAVKNALEQKRAKEENKKAENIMKARLRLHEFAINHNLNELLQATLDEVQNLTGSQFGFYLYLDADQKNLTMQAMSTLTLQLFGKDAAIVQHANLGQPEVWADFIQKRKPVIINHYPDLPQSKERPAGHLQIFRELFVPVLRNEKIVAVLGVGNKAADYNDDDIQIVSRLADMGWDIADIKISEETVRQRVAELTALHAIDSAVSAHLSPKQTLEILLDQLVACLRVDAAADLRHDPREHTLVYGYGRGFKTPVIERTCLQFADTPANRAVLERRTLQSHTLRHEVDFFKRGEWETEGFVDYIAVPLMSNSQLIGVCELYFRSEKPVGSDWLRTLETLTGQAALVVDHLQIFQELQQANADLLKAYDATIAGWSRAMDLRDKETENHTRRVTELSVRLAQRLGMSDEEIVNIRRGSLLHDIGKLGVPDRILTKPAKLIEEEWAAMQRHPQLAFDMLNSVEYLLPALDIPYCHHEKWDGTGYPRGLKGEEIPLAARLFALADVFDALTSDRPYRQAWTRAQALRYIREQSGIHFDPMIVRVFLSLLQTGVLKQIE